MNRVYPFDTSIFTVTETAGGLLVQCDFCDYSARFGTHANAGPVGTELLLHRLKCESGQSSSEFVFAADTWSPLNEPWTVYEYRVRRAFTQSLIAGASQLCAVNHQ